MRGLGTKPRARSRSSLALQACPAVAVESSGLGNCRVQFLSPKHLIDLNNVARRRGQLFHNLTQIFTRQRRYLRPLAFCFFDELWILYDLIKSAA